MGELENAYSPTIILFQPHFLQVFPVTDLAKVTYWDIEISNFN